MLVMKTQVFQKEKAREKPNVGNSYKLVHLCQGIWVFVAAINISVDLTFFQNKNLEKRNNFKTNTTPNIL